MAHALKISHLGDMTPEERHAALDDLARSAGARRNGQTAILNSRIRAFELRYEMTSDELRAGLKSGTIRETADVSRWLFWLSARDDR